MKVLIKLFATMVFLKLQFVKYIYLSFHYFSEEIKQ